MKLTGIVGFLAIGILTGCGTANENSIYRTTEFSGGKAVFVDAKQRALLSNKAQKALRQTDGTHITQTVTQYCAEPSPDVFSVLSSSISLSSALSQAEKASLNLQLSRSISENGSNIGLRTQTITVLRDMMYRLCERYINGALSAEEFAIQAGRDQRIMVSVLAIEQLTGAIQPRTVVIGAGGQASAGENIAVVQAQLDATRDDLKAAETELSENQTKLETAKENKKAVEAKTPDTSYTQAQKDADLAAADAAIATAEKSVEASTTKVSDRKKNVAALNNQLATLREISSTGTTTGMVIPETVLQGRDVSNVATAVTDIVRMTFETDEITLTCLKHIAKQNSIGDFCEAYLAREQEEQKQLTNELMLKRKAFQSLPAGNLLKKQE